MPLNLPFDVPSLLLGMGIGMLLTIMVVVLLKKPKDEKPKDVLINPPVLEVHDIKIENPKVQDAKG